MKPLHGHSFPADVFDYGRAAQQLGEERTAVPTMVDALTGERWQAGWDAGERAETATSNLVIDMPALGDWMFGAGKYSGLLTELLDANTPLIEEEEQVEKEVGLLPWRVRLTAWGITIRAQLIADRQSVAIVSDGEDAAVV